MEQQALALVAEDTAGQVASILDADLSAPDLEGATDPFRYAQLDFLVRRNILCRNAVRVRIWTPDGLVLYSDEQELVGRRFPMTPELEKAVAGKVAMQVTSPETDGNGVQGRRRTVTANGGHRAWLGRCGSPLREDESWSMRTRVNFQRIMLQAIRKL